MSNIKINDVFQRIQYAATNGQTQFAIPFPFFNNDYVVVWQDGVQIFEGAAPGEYGITGAGSPSGGLLTLVTPAPIDSIITIEGVMPIDRTSIYSATISNLTGSDLNGDFNREVVMMKQIETTQALLQLQYAPWALVSQDQTVTRDRFIPILAPNQIWAMNDAGTEIIPYDVPSGGGLGPDDATYLIQVANANLPNAQIMGSLASGFVVNTQTTGVQLTRELDAEVGELVVANPAGIGGNPVYGFADNAVFPGSEGLGIIQGTTAQRPGVPIGTNFRFNTDLQLMEYYDGSWIQLSEFDGVLTAQGTENQVLVNGTFGTPVDGAVVFTLPQDIDTTSDVEFNSIALSPDGILDLAGNTVLGTLSTVGATNHISVINQIAGAAPGFIASGETNTDFNLQTTGTGVVSFVTESNIGFNIVSGTGYQHATRFNFANTPATRDVTLQDSDGTIAFTSQLPSVDTVNLTNGQVWIGSTGNPAVAANLTAGPGISIANAAGGITISGTGSGTGFTHVTGTSQTMVADAGYVPDNVALCTLTLPTTAAFGTAITIVGLGAGGWKIAQNASQLIHVGSSVTTTGVGGSLASTNRYDSIDLLCVVANTTWVAWGAPQSSGLTIV